MAAGSPDQARKRYYLVRADRTLDTGGLLFANREEALVDGRLAGTHERREPGYPHPLFLGVPPLRAKPKLVIGGGGSTALDYHGDRPVFISTRAKKLIEAIDPEGLEFAQCETVTPDGEPTEPYWWMAVIRWVEEFDERRSDFEWYRDSNPTAPDAQTNPSISALYDIHMPEGFPDNHHAFWFAHYRLYPVFDQVLADAWRSEGLTGLQFTPLQRPTEAEFERRARFVNHPYWAEKAASHADR